MKILFDNQKFTTDAHGGIVRYFTELMRHFDQMPDVQYEMPIACSNTEYLHELSRFQHIKPLQTYADFLPKLRFRGKGRLYRLWCQLWSGRENSHVLKRALLKGDYDLLHPTYFDAGALRYLNDKPFVLTIYDMIHELYLAKIAKLDPTVRYKKMLAEKATRIIAISESTKRDIIKLLGVPSNKIDVIYLGNSLVPRAEDVAQRPSGAPTRYILFVGNRTHYKNFISFAKAAAPLLREQPDLHLVCVGGGAFDNSENELFAREQITQRVHQTKAHDRELAQYYAHAEAFIFPTLYEGFGIPVLEAFACGCPAILSNTSSLPEVGGTAAAYFDPQDPQSIYQAIKDVVNSPERRQQMIAAGKEQLALFSWVKTAHETVEAYRRVLVDHKAQKAA